MSGPLLDEILGAWREQHDRGDAPQPDALIKAYPEHAAALRARFAAMALLDHAVDVPAQPEGPVPVQIGEYQIIRELGRGGMAIVYEAHQVAMSRRVALKVLSPSVTNSTTSIRRFQQEALAAGRLNHTNIVTVHDLGEADGHWYYAMELVDGDPLDRVIQRLRDEPRKGRSDAFAVSQDQSPHERIAEVFAGVADAVQVAHQMGVIHRDLKPSNLMLDPHGRLKVTDFGLARLEDDAMGLTKTGSIVGTPLYMSPEQALSKRERIDHRTDIYSLGASLYELLTLKAPFQGSDLQTLVSQIVTEEPRAPRAIDPTIPRDLETIVTKAMAKDPGDRYQSAKAMEADLVAFAHGLPIQARPLGPIARAWRRAKRRKVRYGLAAASVILAVVAIGLSAIASQQADANAQLEYEALCRSGYERVAQTSGENVLGDLSTGARQFARAIELVPDRYEAWFGRSFAGSRGSNERLADIDGAAARGLPTRVAHLARADVLRLAERVEEAQREESLAGTTPDNTAEGAYLEARLRASTGDWEEAERLLDAAIERATVHSLVQTLAWRERAQVRECRGDLEGALADLIKVDSAGAQGVSTRVRRADLWADLGNEIRAERLFQDVLDEVIAQGTEAGFIELVEACQRTRDTWRDRATSKAVERYPGSLPILRHRATALWWRGEQRAALDLFGRTVALHPDDVQARAEYARHLAVAGRHEEAIREATAATTLAPDDAEAQSATAVALGTSGQLDRALEAGVKAIELDPFDAIVAFYYAQVLEHAGQLEQALAEARRARQLDPRRISIRLVVIKLLQSLKRTDEALAEAQAALRLSPSDPQAHSLHGITLMHLGRQDEALVALDRAVSLSVGMNRGVRAIAQSRADLLNAMERFDEALAETERLIAPESESRYERHKAHHTRAAALGGLGRWKESLAELERAGTEACANPAGLCDLKARALEGLGQHVEALETAEAGLALDPNMANLHAWRALALGHLGHWAKARAPAERRLELTPHDPYAVVQLLAVLERTEPAAGFKRCEAWLTAHGGEHPRIRASLGGAYARQKEYAKATPHLEAAVKGDLSATRWKYNALYLLRLSYVELRQWDQALAAFARLLEAGLEVWEMVGGTPAEYAANRSNYAGSLALLGRHEAALKVVYEILAEQPNDLRALVAGANSLFALGRGLQAQDLARRLTAVLPPDTTLGTLAQMQALAVQGYIDETLTEFEERFPVEQEGAATNPQIARQLSDSRATLLILARRADEAIPFVEAALLGELGAQTRTALQATLALALLNCGRSENALAQVDAALEYFSTSVSLLDLRASCLATLGRKDEALVAWSEARSRAPALLGGASTLLRLGRTEEALKLLEHLYPHPQPLLLANLRVRTLRRLGRVEEGRQVAVAALGDRAHVPSGRRLPRAYLEAVAGEREAALKFLKAQPESGEAWMHYDRAVVYAVLGDRDKALQLLGMAVKAGYRPTPGTGADPDLGPLGTDPEVMALLGQGK